MIQPVWEEQDLEQEKGGSGMSGTISREISEKRLHQSGMCTSTGCSTRGRESIGFETYNIRNSRNVRVDSALKLMSQANLDLGIFRETNLTGGVYTDGSTGYSVIATDSLSQNCGGVVFFYLGSHSEVQAKCHWLLAGNMGLAVVHHRRLPHTRQHLNNRECRRNAL